MTDLTNKILNNIIIPNNDAGTLLKLYSPLLEYIKPEQRLHYAFIFNVAFNYIKQKYPELNKNWKAWSIVILKKKFNVINTDTDIIKIIDEFVLYYKNEYDKFCDDLICHDENDRDYSFVLNFIFNNKTVV